MNALQVDPKTGFLDADNVNAFGSDRKSQFLDICRKIRQQTKGWPDFGKVCEELGISHTTFERHLDTDPKFKQEFRNLLLGGKWQLESQLFNLGNKKGFEALIWLRKWFPSEYNPEYKGNITVDVNVVNGLINKANALDAEISSTPNQSLENTP